MNYQKIAGEIIRLTGGKENIETVQNCMTRLRLTLKDESLADEVGLKGLEDTKGFIKAGGQYQIIVGKEASNLCAEVKTQVDYHESIDVAAATVDRKMKWYERVMDVLSGSVILLIGFKITLIQLSSLLSKIL